MSRSYISARHQLHIARYYRTPTSARRVVRPSVNVHATQRRVINRHRPLIVQPADASRPRTSAGDRGVLNSPSDLDLFIVAIRSFQVIQFRGKPTPAESDRRRYPPVSLGEKRIHGTVNGRDHYANEASFSSLLGCVRLRGDINSFRPGDFDLDRVQGRAG